MNRRNGHGEDDSPPTPREELEAVVWRHWPAQDDPARGRAAVEAVVAAAERYAAAVTAQPERARPARPPRPSRPERPQPRTHFGTIVSACGYARASRGADLTLDTADVDCGLCLRTTRYLEAYAAALSP
jgi:hypothetical protein